MNSDKVKEVVVAQIAALNELCRGVSPGFDVESVHQFRVSFKYLRSFLRLIRMHNEDKGLRLPEGYKKLYRAAGLVRDAQLESAHVLQNEPDLQNYHALVAERLELGKKEWDRNFSTTMLAKFHKQAVNWKAFDLPEGVLANFIRHRFDSMQTQMDSRHPDDENLHLVRKDAKDIINATLLAEDESPEDMRTVRHDIPLNELSKMADEIGEYNNERNRLQNLSGFEAPSGRERKRVQAIKKETGTRAKKHKKGLVEAIRDLLLKTHKK